MRKALIVARREFLYNVRRPGYLFASFGVPLLTIVLLVIIFAIAFQSESDSARVGSVGYVDQAGVLYAGREKPEHFNAYSDETAGRAALEAGEIGALFVLPADYLSSGDVKLYSMSGLPDATTDEINSYLITNLGAELDTALVERIQEPLDLSLHTLDNNRTLKEDAIFGVILLPFIFVMLLLMASQTASTYLMAGVVEEKTNRIMEILITSITPFQMLVGKILGLGALGLLQVLVWIGLGALALRMSQGVDMLTGIGLPLDMVIVSLIYFVLSFLLFASVMAGIGAVVGSEQEAKQMSGFVVFLTIMPLFFLISFIEDPNGTIPTIFTLIPMTAPFAVILRMSFGSVPPWQLAVSIGLLVLTTLVVIWGSARVFRWSLLMYGKRPGVRDLLRAVRRPPRLATVATEERAV
jgi:ABC-2 type transport system permease protein